MWNLPTQNIFRTLLFWSLSFTNLVKKLIWCSWWSVNWSLFVKVGCSFIVLPLAIIPKVSLTLIIKNYKKLILWSHNQMWNLPTQTIFRTPLFWSLNFTKQIWWSLNWSLFVKVTCTFIVLPLAISPGFLLTLIRHRASNCLLLRLFFLFIASLM